MSSILSSGSILKSRYKIERTIYEAPIVNIYYSQDLHMPGRFWAIREMQTVSNNPIERMSIANKFLKESSILSRLSHPVFAKVIDFFVDGIYLYIVRDFIPGADLSSLLESRTEPFLEEQVLNWGLQLADFFMYLTSQKIPPVFFKEFNMGNIILTPNSEIKITDMGLARLFYDDSALDAIGALGANEYAAPEQYDAENPNFDSRSLVFSLAAFMYHALTKVNPTVSFAEHKPIMPVDALNPSVSSNLREILKKALELNPIKRFSSITEMKKQIASCIKPKHKSKTSPKTKISKYSEPSSSGNNFFVILTVVLTVIICFLGYYFFFR